MSCCREGDDTRKWTIKAHGLSEWRVRELQAVCRQYDKLRRGTEAQRQKARCIEQAARETQAGAWEAVLMDNACRGVSYEHIDWADMPTSHRNAFFAARREFFSRLDELLGF